VRAECQFVITLALGAAAALAPIALVEPAGASTMRAVQVARPVVTGGIGLRLVDVPADARNDPRAQMYIIDRLAPGAVIRRRIAVSNTTTSAVRVDLYAAAAIITNGAFQGISGRAQNDLSNGTSVSPSASEVPAAGSMTATVTITVPSDLVSGEHYGVIWAETRSPAAGDGITQISRVGIRLYLSIGPGAAAAPNFEIESLTARRVRDGRPTVVATVRNTGGRALDLNGDLQLSAGPGGLRAGPFAATLGTTLGIGSTEPVTIMLDKQVPAGPWDARITLHSGLLSRSARATIAFPAVGSADPVRATPARSPWPHRVIIDLAVVAVALAFSISGAHLVLRRRRVFA
jgi:hypothetical protein